MHEPDVHALPDIVKSGDRLASLIAIRDKLANDLARTTGKDSAPLALRLQAVIDDIDRLTVKTEESKIEKLRDELAAKRADRERNAADSA